MSYALFLSLFFLLPAALAGLFVRRAIRAIPRTLLSVFTLVLFVGGFWDWLAVRSGLWRYAGNQTIGLWLAGLPLEEFLGFYILGPLLIVVVTLVCLRVFPAQKPTGTE